MWRTMSQADPQIDLLARMERAVEKVRARLDRAVRSLERAGIPHAVAGGNAVAAWVATVDEAAVRNTRDVDLLVERRDFEAVRAALESAGFVHRRAGGIELFLDGPGAKARDAVHLIFAGEKVMDRYAEPAPSTGESEISPQGLRIVSLPALARMKLASFRDKDRMHLRDLIDVGLLGREHLGALGPELSERLAWLLDHPED